MPNLVQLPEATTDRVLKLCEDFGVRGVAARCGVGAKTIYRVVGEEEPRFRSDIAQKIINGAGMNGAAKAKRSKSDAAEPELVPDLGKAAPRPKGTKTKVMFVTPDIAEKWLSGPKLRNRRVSEDHVMYFARLFKLGEFPLTHQGIAFDTRNRLMDGQHRLEACVRAGVGFWTYVTWGIVTNAMGYVDQGKDRSAHDVLRITGALGKIGEEVPSSNKLGASMTTVLWRVFGGLRGKTTLSERIKIFRYYGDSFVWAMRLYSRLPRYARLSHLATALMLVHHKNPAKAETFADGLCTGAGLPKGSPILALRNYLSGERLLTRASDTKQVQAAKLLRAAQAYIQGEKLSKLQQGPGTIQKAFDCFIGSREQWRVDVLGYLSRPS